MITSDVVIKRISDSATKQTYTDWGLILAPYTLDTPDAQTSYVTITGRDGKLDLTEALGQLNYNNRSLELTFTEPTNFDTAAEKYSTVANFLHGQRVEITLPNDTGYYLVGRCKVYKLDRSKKSKQISISIDCDPWKYKQAETTVNDTIGTLPYDMVIANLRMPTTPKIVTTGTVVMGFEGTDYSWNAGTHTNAAIVLKEGNNTFTFKTGSIGEVTVTYQEGTL